MTFPGQARPKKPLHGEWDERLDFVAEHADEADSLALVISRWRVGDRDDILDLVRRNEHIHHFIEFCKFMHGLKRLQYHAKGLDLNHPGLLERVMNI